MGIDNARRGAVERAALGAHALPVALDLLPRDPADGHVNGLPAVRVQLLELVALRLVLGHDPFARVAVRHRVLGAEVVQQLPAPHAELRLERRGRVVDARVDDLAVARRRFRAERRVTLDQQRRRVRAARRELVRNR